GNIKPGQPSGDSPGSGLDAFLQTMDTDSTGVASAERNRNGRPQRTRSQQIQQNLRECPAANTAKELKCRQEICAVYAGRDPAWPAGGRGTVHRPERAGAGCVANAGAIGGRLGRHPVRSHARVPGFARNTTVDGSVNSRLTSLLRTLQDPQ